MHLIVEHIMCVNYIPDVAQTPSLSFKEINGINFGRKAYLGFPFKSFRTILTYRCV